MNAALLEKIKEQKVSAATGLVCFGKIFEFHNEVKCKGCGACTRKCPKGIKVHKVIQAIEKGDWSKLDIYPIEECIKCGSCSYYCSAGKTFFAFQYMLADSLFGKVKKSTVRIGLIGIAALRGIADCIENGLLLYVICSYPRMHIRMISVASRVTRIKMLFTALWVVILIIGIIASSVLKWEKK